MTRTDRPSGASTLVDPSAMDPSLKESSSMQNTAAAFTLEHVETEMQRRKWIRLAQVVISFCTLVCSCVVGSSYEYTPSLQFAVFVSLTTLLLTGFLFMEQCITSLHLTLLDRIDDRFRHMMTALLDGVYFIFWFAAAVDIGNTSRIHSSSTLCWQAPVLAILYYNCQALVATAFFLFMGWFSYFASCFYSCRVAYHILRKAY